MRSIEVQLKLVTYNIKSGIYHPDGLNAIARVLEELEPQVIALQEVDRGTRRVQGQDQTARLSQLLGMPYHCFGAATPWEGGGEYGLALISSLPLEEARTEHLWVPSGPDVPHGEREPRAVLTVKLEGLGLRVLVTHLGLSPEQRLRQAEQLVERVHGANGEPVVLMGDLNGSPDSPEIRYLAGELGDVLVGVPEGERITFPSGDPEKHGSDFLVRTLDYVFVSEAVRVVSARVVPDHTLASDHNPIEAVIDL